jgi:cobalt/nickel transport system permease protein
LALGLQPIIAHTEGGQPLFFPFGFSVTLPAVMIPHAVIGVGEGILTLLMWRFVERRGWFAQA